MLAVSNICVDIGSGIPRDAGAPFSRVEACAALEVPRASYYRDLARRARAAMPSPPESRPRTPSPRALSHVERQGVLDLLHAKDFADLAVPQAPHKLGRPCSTAANTSARSGRCIESFTSATRSVSDATSCDGLIMSSQSSSRTDRTRLGDGSGHGTSRS